MNKNPENTFDVDVLIPQKLVSEVDYVSSTNKATSAGIQYMERRHIKWGSNGEKDVYQFSTKLSSLTDREIFGKAFYSSNNDIDLAGELESCDDEAFENASESLALVIESINQAKMNK